VGALTTPGIAACLPVAGSSSQRGCGHLWWVALLDVTPTDATFPLRAPKPQALSWVLSEMHHGQPRSTSEEVAGGDGSASMDLPEDPTPWVSLGHPMFVSSQVCLLLSDATCIPGGELKSSLLPKFLDCFQNQSLSEALHLHGKLLLLPTAGFISPTFRH